MPYEKHIECSVLPRITGNLPHREANIMKLNISEHCFLADPMFHIPADVDMLLGMDMHNEIAFSDKIKIPEGPTLQHTRFGWILGGTLNSPSAATSTTSYAHFCSTEDDEAQFRLHQEQQSSDNRLNDDNKDDDEKQRTRKDEKVSSPFVFSSAR